MTTKRDCGSDLVVGNSGTDALPNTSGIGCEGFKSLSTRTFSTNPLFFYNKNCQFTDSCGERSVY